MNSLVLETKVTILVLIKEFQVCCLVSRSLLYFVLSGNRLDAMGCGFQYISLQRGLVLCPGTRSPLNLLLRQACVMGSGLHATSF